MRGIGKGFRLICVFAFLKSCRTRIILSYFGMQKVGTAHSDSWIGLMIFSFTCLSISLRIDLKCAWGMWYGALCWGFAPSFSSMSTGGPCHFSGLARDKSWWEVRSLSKLLFHWMTSEFVYWWSLINLGFHTLLPEFWLSWNFLCVRQPCFSKMKWLVSCPNIPLVWKGLEFPSIQMIPWN